MRSSKIEWTNATWNPLTGCTKVSPGCKNCYAERMANRLKAMGQEHYANGFELSIHPDSLYLPISWKVPSFIFVNSMSDLFHKNVHIDFIMRIFSVMKQADWHVFQVLTKRTNRLKDLAYKLEWPENVWMGVSVENINYTHRIDHLKTVPAFKKFLSFEPLLGPLSYLDLDGIDWVIVGGESGPKSRPIEEEWVIDIKNRCIEKSIPFFFKQWGGVNKKRAGRILEGQTWDQIPNRY